MTMPETLLFYDFETYGTDVASCRPVQFGAIRTDLTLNPIEDPIKLLCRPAPDFLPSPISTSIHGITPQFALEHGISESEFAGKIYEEMSRPGTCSVGYNSMAFDSKVARFLFWRNFLPPYKAEYDQGCSKWDIRTLTEAAFGLRPQGIQWPSIDGKPSLRLEDLAQENGLTHSAAHDALSDVEATIALAKLIRDRQPRLFDYAYLQRTTSATESFLKESTGPLLHVSSFYGYDRRCFAPVLLLTRSPEHSRSVLGIDLGGDLDVLEAGNAEYLRELLYTPAHEIPPWTTRPPVIRVKTNEATFLAPLATAGRRLSDSDMEDIDAKVRQLEEMEGLPGLLQEIWRPKPFPPGESPDGALYDSFVGRDDEARMLAVREGPPEHLWELRSGFRDGRLNDLLLLYHARNHPDSLDAPGRVHFERHANASLSAQRGQFQHELEEIRSSGLGPLAVELEAYRRSLLAAS